jgi:predicted fused transcriptional regulator/phosphomethylpyrimidine kinase
MQGKVQKMEHHNPGIKCVVNTCYYYDEGDHCKAQKIEVQRRNATSSHETDCATFTKNDQSMT